MWQWCKGGVFGRVSGPFLLHWVAASASPAPPMTLAFLFRAVLPVLHRHSPFLRSHPNLSSVVFLLLD